MASSRLGDIAPRGAARFASSTVAEEPKEKKADSPQPPLAPLEVTSERHNVITAKREKLPMTIRLTPEAIDRLAELERALRRTGIRARQASASEIVDALVRAATPDELRGLIRRR
jgi:hypothetical protein